MISVKNILKSWDDKPNCQRMEYFSKAKFDCLHSENDIIVGRFDYPGFHNCESFCGLLFKFETSIFKKNIVKVVLIGLPENYGTSITQICEGIAQYVHNNMLMHFPLGDIKWYEHFVRTEGERYSVDILEMFFDVHNIEGRYYYQDPNWKNCEDWEFLEEVVAIVSRRFNVKYKERREEYLQWVSIK